MNHPIMHTHVLGASFYMHDNWVPSKDEIIIGRGKKVYGHAGNQKLRDLVQKEVTAYSNAKNRAAKSAIIIRIFKVIRADSSVGFVKKDAKTKKYYAVEDAAAKCAIAQCFRDALADLGYKSSKQYKQKTRDAMRRIASDVGHVSEPMVAKPTMRRSASSDNPSVVAMMGAVSRSIFEEVSEDESWEPIKETPAQFWKQTLLDSRRKTGSAHGVLQESPPDLLAVEKEGREWPKMVEETNLRAPSNETILSFEKLYKAFGSNVDTSSDPFEPVPLKESSSKLISTGLDACFFGLSFDDASSHSSKEAVAV